MKKRMKFLSVVALSSMALISYGFTTTDINHEQTVYETQENEISTQEVSTTTIEIPVENSVLNSVELIEWNTNSTSDYWELTFAFNYNSYINYDPVIEWDVVTTTGTYDWKNVTPTGSPIDSELISPLNSIYVEKLAESNRYTDYFFIQGFTQDTQGLLAGETYTFAFNITQGLASADNIEEFTFTVPDSYLADVTVNYISNTNVSLDLTFNENIITSPTIEWGYDVNGNGTIAGTEWVDVTPITDANIYNQTILIEGLPSNATQEINFRIDGVVQGQKLNVTTLSNTESISLIEEVSVTSTSPYLAELDLTINSSIYTKAKGIELDYKIQTEEEYANGQKNIWINARAKYDTTSSTITLNFNETYLQENTTYIVQFRINGVQQSVDGSQTFTFTTDAFTDYGLTAGIIAGSALLGTLLLFGGYYLYNRMHKSKKQKKENK